MRSKIIYAIVLLACLFPTITISQSLQVNNLVDIALNGEEVTIDGTLTDWDDAQFVYMSQDSPFFLQITNGAPVQGVPESPADFSAFVALKMTSEALYIGARVRDEGVPLYGAPATPNLSFDYDHISVFLGLYDIGDLPGSPHLEGPTGNQGNFQFINPRTGDRFDANRHYRIAPGTDDTESTLGPDYQLLLRALEHDPATFNSLDHSFIGSYVNNNLAGTIAAVVKWDNGKGYDIEWKIPFASLSGKIANNTGEFADFEWPLFTPAHGMVIPFDVDVTDRDQETGLNTYLRMGQYPSLWRDAHRFGMRGRIVDLAQASFDAPSSSYYVDYKAVQNVEVDGDMSDWADASFYGNSQDHPHFLQITNNQPVQGVPQSPADFSYYYGMKMDDENLYIGLIVRDEGTPMIETPATPNLAFNYDYLGLYLGLYNLGNLPLSPHVEGGSPDASDNFNFIHPTISDSTFENDLRHYRIKPGLDNTETTRGPDYQLLLRNVPHDPNNFSSREFTYNGALVDTTISGTIAASKRWDNEKGYFLEWKIPFRSLAGKIARKLGRFKDFEWPLFVPEPGMTIAFDADVTDLDTGNRGLNRFMRLGRYPALWRDSHRFGMRGKVTESGLFSAIDYEPIQSTDPQSFNIDINISDANANSQTLTIGTKADATIGFDQAYDQYAPPAPPVGAFDARIVSNGEEFYTSYIPIDGDEHEWLIKFSPSTNGLPITIRWDPEALLESIQGQTCVPKNACFGELMLTDVINGSFVNVDMAKSSSITITESFITQLKIVKTTVDFSATIRVADTGGNSMSLGIGTTADATAGFDLNLDQYAPPSPPSGAFDARIRTATDDYLKNILPTTTTSSEWVIGFAPASGSGPITLSWDPLEFPEEGQVLLTDVINQQLVRVKMRNQSSYTVTNDGITQLKVVHQLTSSYERQYNAGWNLVGLPLEVQHDGYQSLFPGSISNTLFSFGSGYQSQTKLQSGKGYWLRFSNSSTVTFEGTDISNKEIPLNSGWNLISGLSEPVALASISDPGNILVPGTLFEFANGYRAATGLQPGLGYWVRANASGSIGLSTGTPSKSNNKTPDLTGLDRIEIIHGENQLISPLYFGKAYPSGHTAENFSVPPVPPAGIMDVRFDGDTWVSAQSNPTLLLQNLQAGAALRIHSGQDHESAIQYQIIQHTDDGRQKTSVIKGSESVILSQNTHRIEIQRLGEELPVEFTLDQNYPNPFNPTTTIRFGLPESADVTLEVYTVLGQRVMTLVNENRSAGWHTVSFNGANLSSGVYVYRIQAGGMVQTKKLMFIK